MAVKGRKKHVFSFLNAPTIKGKEGRKMMTLCDTIGKRESYHWYLLLVCRVSGTRLVLIPTRGETGQREQETKLIPGREK